MGTNELATPIVNKQHTSVILTICFSFYQVFSSGSSRGVNRTNFDAWKSSSFSCQSDKTWVMKRPDGSSISGEVGTDTVVVGGLEVPDQLLGLGKVVGGTSTERMVTDGTLGLSMPQTRYIQRNGVNDPQTSFVARMAEAKILPEDAQLFTTALCRPTQGGKQESFCTFGYVDEDMVDGEISWAKVDSGKGMWMFPSASTTINDDKISRSGNMAVVDSSTPLILLSDEACEAFYKKIEGAKYSRLRQGWLVPGGETQGMPELRVAVGETEFGISTSEYAFSPADGDMFFGVVQSRGNNEFDVLGVPFLRSVYAVSLVARCVFRYFGFANKVTIRDRSGTLGTSALGALQGANKKGLVQCTRAKERTSSRIQPCLNEG